MREFAFRLYMRTIYEFKNENHLYLGRLKDQGVAKVRSHEG